MMLQLGEKKKKRVLTQDDLKISKFNFPTNSSWIVKQPEINRAQHSVIFNTSPFLNETLLSENIVPKGKKKPKKINKTKTNDQARGTYDTFQSVDSVTIPE